MLRVTALLLILLNTVYFAWSQGLLRVYGWAPQVHSEPQRMAAQIKPEAISVISEAQLRKLEAASATPARPNECLQAGLFDATQTQALRSALSSTLPNVAWLLDSAMEPGVWLVYYGKFVSAEELAKKRRELQALGLKADELHDPALEFGLSLGSFDSETQAQAELGNLKRRGVNSARVLLSRAPVRGTLLRLPNVDNAQRALLPELKAVLAGKLLSPCR